MVTATKQETFEDIQQRALHRLLTADDLALLPDDGNRYEIIGGKLIVSPSPTFRHQQVSMKLGNALDTFLSRENVGVAVAAPMDVRLSNHDVVQPDLLVVLHGKMARIESRGVIGAPDLVVEILSPSSIETDFLRKAKLYEQSGVREYWIVNPESEMVSVQLLEDDRFALAGEFGRGDTLRSTVLEGFELEIASIFPQPIDAPAQETTEE